jgi:hypothetical protein
MGELAMEGQQPAPGLFLLSRVFHDQLFHLFFFNLFTLILFAPPLTLC